MENVVEVALRLGNILSAYSNPNLKNRNNKQWINKSTELFYYFFPTER